MFLTTIIGMAMVFLSPPMEPKNGGHNPMAKGEFEVQLKPLDHSLVNEAGLVFGRMRLEKRFQGDLEGRSVGEMFSVRTPKPTSAGYVAMEHITGTVDGKSGSFVVQHLATMHEGEERQVLEVVPNTGTGDLAGIRGTMTITIKEGKHFYTLAYQLPQ